MSRKARQKSKSGVYHIVLRGINKQILFEDQEDREKFLQDLQKYKDISSYSIYGYCLMDNHIHLLMQEGIEPLSQSMKRIGVGYVSWYNKKYDRFGHLFQDRFRSEVVENDTYMLTVLRYIHQNPIKAGLTKEMAEYKWSSYAEYVNGATKVSVDFALGMFAEEKEKALRFFKEFMKDNPAEQCLDADTTKMLTDEEAIKVILKSAKVNTPVEVQSMEKVQRNEALRSIKQNDGLSTRQIARITGISQSVVARA